MLLGALLLSALSACVAPPAPPVRDPRVQLTPDLGLLADPVVMAPGPGVRGQVRLVNPSSTDRSVIQTTEWASATGMPVRSILSSPRRLTVPRFGDAVIEVIAPNPQAIRFQVRVEPDYAN